MSKNINICKGSISSYTILFFMSSFSIYFFIANIKYDKNNHYPTTTYKSILLLFQNTKPYYIPFYTTLYFAFISGRTRNNSLFYLCKLLVKKILTINTDCKLLCFISYLLILDITDTFVIKIFFNSFFDVTVIFMLFVPPFSALIPSFFSMHALLFLTFYCNNFICSSFFSFFTIIFIFLNIPLSKDTSLTTVISNNVTASSYILNKTALLVSPLCGIFFPNYFFLLL